MASFAQLAMASVGNDGDRASTPASVATVSTRPGSRGTHKRSISDLFTDADADGNVHKKHEWTREADILYYLSSKNVERVKQEFDAKAESMGRGLRMHEFLWVMLKCLGAFVLNGMDFVIQCIDLFRQVDVNGDDEMEWDEFTSYIVEAGMAQGHQLQTATSVRFAYRYLWSEDSNVHHGVVADIQRLRAPLNVIAVRESGSEMVRMFRPSSDPSRAQLKQVKSIRHDTAYTPHVVQSFVHCPGADVIVSSSQERVVGPFYVSFWDDVKLALKARVKVRTPQTTMCWSSRTGTLYTAGHGVSAGTTGPILAWDVSACKQSATLVWHTSKVTHLLELEGNVKNYLVSASEDGTIVMWDMKSNKVIADRVLEADEYGVAGLCFSQPLELLASWGLPGKVSAGKALEAHKILLWDTDAWVTGCGADVYGPMTDGDRPHGQQVGEERGGTGDMERGGSLLPKLGNGGGLSRSSTAPHIGRPGSLFGAPAEESSGMAATGELPAISEAPREDGRPGSAATSLSRSTTMPPGLAQARDVELTAVEEARWHRHRAAERLAELAAVVSVEEKEVRKAALPSPMRLAGHVFEVTDVVFQDAPGMLGPMHIVSSDIKGYVRIWDAETKQCFQVLHLARPIPRSRATLALREEYSRKKAVEAEEARHQRIGGQVDDEGRPLSRHMRRRSRAGDEEADAKIQELQKTVEESTPAVVADLLAKAQAATDASGRRRSIAVAATVARRYSKAGSAITEQTAELATQANEDSSGDDDDAGGEPAQGKTGHRFLSRVDSLVAIPAGATMSGKPTIILGGDGFRVMRYQQIVSQPTPLVAALFNVQSYTFVTATADRVTIWDAINGRVLRAYDAAHLCEGAEVSTLCLDGRKRKIIVGDSVGRVRVCNFQNMAVMKEVDPHERVVSAVQYSAEDNCVISTSWDCSMNITDENEKDGFTVFPTHRSVLLRRVRLPSTLDDTVAEALESGEEDNGSDSDGLAPFQRRLKRHKGDDRSTGDASHRVLPSARGDLMGVRAFTTGTSLAKAAGAGLKTHKSRPAPRDAYSTRRGTSSVDMTNVEHSPHLNLLATSARGMDDTYLLLLWRYDKTDLVGACLWPNPEAPQHEVTGMAFLEPMPALLSTDAGGNVTLWRVPPNKLSVSAAHRWSGPDPGAGMTCVSAVSVARNPNIPTRFIRSRSKSRTQGFVVGAAPTSEQGFVFFTGDDHGNIHRWELTEAFLESCNLRAISPVQRSSAVERRLGRDRIPRHHLTSVLQRAMHSRRTKGLVPGTDACYDPGMAAMERSTRPLWIGCWKAHAEPVTHVTFMADNNNVFSASADGMARVWSIDGHLLGTLDPNPKNQPPPPLTYAERVEKARIEKLKAAKALAKKVSSRRFTGAEIRAEALHEHARRNSRPATGRTTTTDTEGSPGKPTFITDPKIPPVDVAASAFASTQDPMELRHAVGKAPERGPVEWNVKFDLAGRRRRDEAEARMVLPKAKLLKVAKKWRTKSFRNLYASEDDGQSDALSDGGSSPSRPSSPDGRASVASEASGRRRAINTPQVIEAGSSLLEGSASTISGDPVRDVLEGLRRMDADASMHDVGTGKPDLLTNLVISRTRGSLLPGSDDEEAYRAQQQEEEEERRRVARGAYALPEKKQKEPPGVPSSQRVRFADTPTTAKLPGEGGRGRTQGSGYGGSASLQMSPVSSTRGGGASATPASRRAGSPGDTADGGAGDTSGDDATDKLDADVSYEDWYDQEINSYLGAYNNFGKSAEIGDSVRERRLAESLQTAPPYYQSYEHLARVRSVIPPTAMPGTFTDRKKAAAQKKKASIGEMMGQPVELAEQSITSVTSLFAAGPDAVQKFLKTRQEKEKAEGREPQTKRVGAIVGKKPLRGRRPRALTRADTAPSRVSRPAHDVPLARAGADAFADLPSPEKSKRMPERVKPLVLVSHAAGPGARPASDGKAAVGQSGGLPQSVVDPDVAAAVRAQSAASGTRPSRGDEVADVLRPGLVMTDRNPWATSDASGTHYPHILSALPIMRNKRARQAAAALRSRKNKGGHKPSIPEQGRKVRTAPGGRAPRHVNAMAAAARQLRAERPGGTGLSRTSKALST